MILLTSFLRNTFLFLTRLSRRFWFLVLIWTSFTILFTFRGSIVGLQTFRCWSIFTVTLAWLCHFSLFSTFFFRPIDHFSKLFMLPSLFFFLFLFVLLSFFPFFFHPPSSPSLRIPLFIFKDRLIVNVLYCGYLGDDSFSIMRDLFGKLVVLHINHCNFRHFHEDFR